MRPQLDDQTAEVVEKLADQLTEIDVEMLTFDQQLRVVLKNSGDITIKGGVADRNKLTQCGKIISMLDR